MRRRRARGQAQIKKFFSKLRPELAFNVTESSWKVTIGAASAPPRDKGADVSLLVDALDGLEKLAADQPEERAIGLIIDEFQWLIELGGRDTERQIRSAIQRHKRTGYVFAGSKMRMLTEMTTSAARPFYRLGSLRFVGSVPREEFIQFLLDKSALGGFRVNGVTAQDGGEA